MTFEDFMIFIGQNNHGKSNILSALLYFFGEIECRESDFSVGSTEMFVEIEFGDLDEHDKNQFKKYLMDGNKITVRKHLTVGGKTEYHGYCQIPNEVWLRDDKAEEYSSKEKLQGTGLLEYIDFKGRLSRAKVIEAQNEYLSRHSAEVGYHLDLETNYFLGAKNVAEGIFGNVIYIPSLKYASEEFSIKGNSALNKLLSTMINKMTDQAEGYRSAKKQISELIKGLSRFNENGGINADRPKQISDLEDRINQELKGWKTTLNLDISPFELDDLLKSMITVDVDDGVRTEPTEKGDELQRYLIYTLIKVVCSLIELEHYNINNIKETHMEVCP